MDFRLTEKELALKNEVEAFYKTEMKNAPPGFNGGTELIYATEERFQFHKYMARKLGEKGWLSLAWPKEYGGKGATIMEQLVFSEVSGYHNTTGIDVFGIGMFAPTLLVGANEEQKQRLLPPIASGEASYCQGWSEPNAGSDLASLTTTAIKDGDVYVVNGQKTWTTGAHRADCMFLLARTDPNSKRGKGLSVFYLPTNLPGIEIRPILYMDNQHVFNDVFFKDVRIPARDLIGVEGKGWDLTRQTMNFERSGIGQLSWIRRSLERMTHYINTTRRNGKRLSTDPIVRRKLAKLLIGAELGRTLAYRIAWLHQKNDFQNLVPAASASKLYLTELSQKLANYSTEIMGPYGQLESGERAPLDGYMAELYQYCKGATIFGGTNEVQRNLIAWVGLGLPRLKFK
ncbi:acyl-CoA dehydrogenase family protein [bacterium]|nr:acyl-CoA dehydrogenase family protein [bacterium]